MLLTEISGRKTQHVEYESELFKKEIKLKSKGSNSIPFAQPNKQLLKKAWNIIY